MINYSIIIPHRNSTQYLPKLFSSIPCRRDLEIIIIDNSPVPIKKEDIKVDREYLLLYSPVNKYAGGARNVGLKHASGKWLLFLDADDYFADGAFDFYDSKIDSDADIIYTGMGGVYMDTGMPSDRGDYYTNLIVEYLNGIKTEQDLRLGFPSPCCKLIRREMVEKYNIRFDEIVAGNDQYFSLVTGYMAKKIEAANVITYIATVSRGSLTKRRDYPALEALLYSNLHCNQFLKSHQLSDRQLSVTFPFIDGRHLSFKCHLRFLLLIIKFHQNPFIGISRWGKTFSNLKKLEKRDSKYITKE